MLSGLALLMMRNFLLIILLPLTIGYWLSVKKRINPLKIYWMIVLVMIGAGIILSLVHSPADPLHILYNRHVEFSKLRTATSQMEPLALQPTFNSFFLQLPLAFNHGFLRPYLWETQNIFSLLLSIETFLILLLIIIWIFYREKTPFPSIIIMCITLSILMILITGYIVPNSSSVVRYRSIYLPFIITPLLCTLRFRKQKKSY